MIAHAMTRGPDLYPVPDPRGVLTADTLDEATSLVRTAICPHRLRVNEPPRKSVLYLSSLDLGACGLTNLKYGFDVDIDAGCIDDTYLVKWTLAGQGRLWSGDRTAITSPRSIVITEPTEPTKIHMTAECRHLTVRVSRRALLETLAARLNRPPRKALQFNLEIPMDSDFARAWCELVAHICHVSATAPAALASESVRKQYSRTLMEIMLSAAPHSHTDAIEEPANRPTAWHVGRARDYVHEHLVRGHLDCGYCGTGRRHAQNSAERFSQGVQPDAGGIHPPGASRCAASGAARGGWKRGGHELDDECRHRQFRPFRPVLSRADRGVALDDAAGKDTVAGTAAVAPISPARVPGP